MLHSIKSAASTAKSETAAQLLTACHDRIRNFSGMVRTLAHAEGSPEGEIRSAADAAYRYFSISLPLHEADEEDSLRPRLMGVGEPRITAALDAMHHQHQGIDDLVERLLPILVLLANQPSKLPDVHSELCALSQALSEAFDGHLQLEENVLFPAIQLHLSATSQAALLDEMRQRRKQG